MSSLLLVINDIIVIIFDLLLYVAMFPVRDCTRIPRAFYYLGCLLIVAAYFVATYLFKFPAAVSSACCMTIPSFLLFFYYAKYRDSRFILTFCFIDSISLIVAFIGRIMGVFLKYGDIYSVVILLVLLSLLLYAAKKYAGQYQVLLEEVDTGWGIMAFATAVIYFAMIFFAGYPKPLVQRLEYVPVWSVFALVVLSCYVVFIHSIFKTKKINVQKQRLEREQEIYRMAFNDALTGLYNRASYLEKVNELERRRSQYRNIAFAIMDINEFKKVNDTLGHHVGDELLKTVAAALKTAFQQYDEFIFRMGGDEFLVILQDQSEEQIQALIAQFRHQLKQAQENAAMKVTAAIGYEIFSAQDNRPLESAYILADQYMYADKQKYRESLKEALGEKESCALLEP